MIGQRCVVLGKRLIPSVLRRLDNEKIMFDWVHLQTITEKSDIPTSAQLMQKPERRFPEGSKKSHDDMGCMPMPECRENNSDRPRGKCEIHPEWPYDHR